MQIEHLRALIRRGISENHLPRSGGNPRIFGGKGDGCPCACCHQIIRPDEVQYDVDCQLGETMHTLRMHMRCLHAWEIESRALAGTVGHSVCEDAA